MPTRLALGGASLSRKLPKPGLRAVKRPKKQRQRAQQQLKRQEKRLDRRKGDLNVIRKVRELLPDDRPGARVPRTPKQEQRVGKRVDRSVSAYMGDAPEAKALRRAGILPKQKAPRPEEGGRTVAEATRAIDAAASSGRRPSVSNVTVAKGEWKKVGGLPRVNRGKRKGEADLKFIQTTAAKISNPEIFDTRGPTAKEVLASPDRGKKFLAEVSRASYDDAAAKNLPVGRRNRNPWAISDAQAPENETPEQRRKREGKVLERLLERQGGLDNFDAQTVQQRLDAGKDSFLATVVDAPAFERQFVDPVKEMLDDPVGTILDRSRNTANYLGNPVGESASNWQDVADVASIALTVSAVTGVGALARGGGGLVRTFGRAAMSTADDGTRLGIKGGMSAAMASSAPGRAYLGAINKLNTQQWRAVRAGTGASLIGLAIDKDEYTKPIIEGVLTANIPKAAGATARALVGAITQPIAWAMAGMGTARRGVRALDGDDPYYSSSEYVLAPMDRLLKETLTEIKTMADTFTSKDVERIREATENDFGYITLMSTFWLTRLTAGQTVKSLGAGSSEIAKRIARSPAGMALAKQLRETPGVGRAIEVGEEGVAVGRAKVQQRRDRIRTQLAGGRIIAEEQALMSQFNKNVLRPKQVYNTADSKATGRTVRSRLNSFNSRTAKQYKDSDLDTATPPPVEVEDVAALMASRGIDPRGKTESEVLAQLQALQNGLPRAHSEYRVLDAAIEIPQIWKQGIGPRSRAFNRMYQGIERNDNLLGMIRRRGQEGTEAGERQMLTDREVTATETLATAAKMRGEEQPTTPRQDQAARRVSEQEELDRLELETQSIQETVSKLEERLDTSAQVLEPMVAAERAMVRDEIRGTALGDELRSTSEKLLSIDIRVEDIPNQIRENNLEVVGMRRQLKRGGITREARSQLRSDIEALKAENAALKEKRSEAIALGERLRYLERVANRLVSNPSPALIAARKKYAEIDNEIAGLQGTDKMVARAELARKLNGELKPEEVRAIVAQMEPEVQRAIKQADSVDENLRVIEGKIKENRDSVALNRAAALVIRGGDKGRDDLDQGLLEAERFLAKLTQPKKEGAAPSVGEGMADPESVAAYLKREFGVDIPPDQIRRAADEQVASVTEFVENLRAIKAFVDNASSSARTTRGALKALKNEREKLSIELGPLEEARIMEENRRSLMIGDGGRDAILEEANRIARARIVEDIRLTEFKTLLAQYEKTAERARIDLELEKPVHLVHEQQDAGADLPVAPEAAGTLATARERRRTGELEEEGLVDRQFEALTNAYKNEIERRSYQNMAQHIAREGLIGIRWDDGTIRTVFDETELAKARQLYKEQYGVDLGNVGFLMDRRTFDDAGRFGDFLGAASAPPSGRVASTLRATDKLNEDRVADIENANISKYDNGLDTHIIHDPEFDSIPRAAAVLNKKTRGADGFVFVKQATLESFQAINSDLSGLESFAFQMNRLASRLVLGTSLSWMFAQPFAEMMVLLAQHPLRTFKVAPELRAIRKDGEEAQLALARIVQDTPGPNPASNQRIRTGLNQTQRDFVTATRFLRKIPTMSRLLEFVEEAERPMSRGMVGQSVADVAALRGPGIFDRWKAAWIREAGLLAELDYQLSPFVRAGKAVRDQIDIIEKNADKLVKMDTRQQLEWLNSQEGYDVGLALAKKIDEQLGNWQDLRPGLESAVGQVIFFYPFVRFSLQWALKTYPRDHPVVWTLANTLGIANAEMLERLIDYDPAWPQEWAVVPYFGNPEDESAPTSLMSVGRYTTAGNAITELSLEGGDPLWNAANVTVPFWSIIGRTFAGLDAYGNKLSDGNDGFADNNPGDLAKAGAFLDSVLSLTVPYREVTNRTGFSFQGSLDPNAPATEFVPEIGRDPNDFSNMIRRVLFPALPLPTRITQNKQELAKIVGAQIAARAGGGQPYLFEGKETVMWPGPNGKMREIKFSDVGAELIRERKSQDDKGLYSKRSPKGRKIAREFLRIQGENKFHSEELKKQLKKERELYYRLGAKVDKDSPAWQEKEDERMQNLKSRWFSEWDEVFPGRVYPDSEDKARKMLRAAESNGVRFGGGGGRGLPAPDSTTNPKPVENGQRLSARLRDNTRKRLEDKGMRRVSLADPTLDPETRVNKKGLVTRYRGVKIAGNVTLAEAKEAEDGNGLDIDTKTDLLRTPRIRGIQDGQRQTKQKLRVAKRKIERMGRANGGMPSNVPEEYAKWIRKYAPQIDKQARETYGISGVVFMAKMLQGESGFDMNKVGPDTPYGNARGAAQFIPPTRDAFIEQFGIDPWRSTKEAVQAMALHLDGKSYSKTFGIQGYNPGINDSYYLDQDVGAIVEGRPVDKQALQTQKQKVTELEEQLKLFNKEAKDAGLPLERIMPKATLWAQPKKAKGKASIEWLNGTTPEGINPDIIRLAATISKMTGHNIQITSALRPESSGSNHQVGGALDINALAQSAGGTAETEKMGDAIAYAAVIAAGGSKADAQALASGAAGYVGFTSPNGQPVEFLWKGDGDHRDHVHIAVESGQDRGKRVFRGRRVIGPGALSNGVTSVTGGGGYSSGGGGSAGGGMSGGGSVMADYNDPLEDWVGMDLGPVTSGGGMSYEEGGVDPAVVQAAEASAESRAGDSVKSAAEQLASLPKVQKKKKVPRFDPDNRI